MANTGVTSGGKSGFDGRRHDRDISRERNGPRRDSRGDNRHSSSDRHHKRKHSTSRSTSRVSSNRSVVDCRGNLPSHRERDGSRDSSRSRDKESGSEGDYKECRPDNRYKLGGGSDWRGMSVREAPEYVSMCFSEGDRLVEQCETDRGTHLLTNDSKKIPIGEVVDGTLVMAPQVHKNGGEVSADELCCGDLVVALVKGIPAGRTRLEFIDQTDRGGMSKEFEIDFLFSVVTPKVCFWAPSGLLLEMATESRAGIQRKKDADIAYRIREADQEADQEARGEREEEWRDRRGQSVQELAEERATQKSMPGNYRTHDSAKTACLIFFNGVTLPTRNTKDVMIREDSLQFMMRVAYDRKLYFILNDCLDQPRYREFIADALKESHESGSPLESVQLIRNVSDNRFLEDSQLLDDLMHGRFTGHKGGRLSLASFNQNLKGGLGQVPTAAGRAQIVVAMTSTNFTFRGFYHKDFKRCFQSTFKIFQGVEDVLRRVNDDFLLYTLERVLASWGTIMGTLEVAPRFKGIDLGTPKNCSYLLESMMYAELRRISNPYEDQALDREFRLSILPLLGGKGGGAPRSSVAGLAVPSSMEKACSFDVLRQLGAVHKRTGAPTVCNDQAVCATKHGKVHVDIAMATRAEVETWARSTDCMPYIQSKVMDLVPANVGKFKK